MNNGYYINDELCAMNNCYYINDELCAMNNELLLLLLLLLLKKVGSARIELLRPIKKHWPCS